ncbi:hypothetical protein [Poriferisphaera sp. WC338]|uniref:hypothetical protein n=1 Tax=Poriferisphaera sp. WC338 TaxID=3425129 RepID=UPI003D819D8A
MWRLIVVVLDAAAAVSPNAVFADGPACALATAAVKCVGAICDGGFDDVDSHGDFAFVSSGEE